MGVHNTRWRSFLPVLLLGAIGRAASAQSIEPLRVLERAMDLGPADRERRLAISVSMPYARPREIQAFVDSVSDPDSPDYRRFITPEEVGERFGLRPSQVQGVVDHLRGHGMEITLVSKNRLCVLAQGTVAQAQSAFGTEIREYGLAPLRAGEPDRFFAHAGKLRLPAALRSLVIDVRGLESYTRPRHCATTLTPEQTRGLYDTEGMFRSGLTGRGRTIGVASFDGFRSADWLSYISFFSLPFPLAGPGTNIVVVPCNGGGAGAGHAGLEGDLDIQMELGMAPLADFRIYDSPPGLDLIAVLAQQANDNECDIISASYSWDIFANTANAAHNLHLSMTAQGITYLAASGDRGTGIDPWGYPHYEPEVLSVGGTRASVDPVTRRRIIEISWGGSGGGWSTRALPFNVRPPWQVGNGVPPVTATNNHRLTPDVAFHSAGNSSGAYPFFSRGAYQTSYSGTSFASPMFAGCLALVEVDAMQLGGLVPDASGHRRLGRIQDLIYGLNGRPDVIYDINNAGTNGTLPDGTPSQVGNGWDTVTGWGPVDGAAFVPYVACASGAHCGTGIPFCFGDGSLSTACPCDNFGTWGRGCENSSRTGGARLAAAGSTSPDRVVFSTTGEPSAAFGILVQAPAARMVPFLFGDGLLCIGRQLRRLYSQKANAGAISVPAAGEPSVTARSAALGDPLLPGTTRHYQVWYRDPDATYCVRPPHDRTNVSNAVSILW